MILYCYGIAAEKVMWYNSINIYEGGRPWSRRKKEKWGRA